MCALFATQMEELHDKKDKQNTPAARKATENYIIQKRYDKQSITSSYRCHLQYQYKEG